MFEAEAEVTRIDEVPVTVITSGHLIGKELVNIDIVTLNNHDPSYTTFGDLKADILHCGFQRGAIPATMKNDTTSWHIIIYVGPNAKFDGGHRSEVSSWEMVKSYLATLADDEAGLELVYSPN